MVFKIGGSSLMHYEENNLVAALIAMTFLAQLIYAEAGVNGYVF